MQAPDPLHEVGDLGLGHRRSEDALHFVGNRAARSSFVQARDARPCSAVLGRGKASWYPPGTFSSGVFLHTQ